MPASMSSCVGSSASNRTRLSGQYCRVSVVLGAVDQVGPVLEHDDLVGQALGLDQEVRAHHDGVAVGGHLPDELEHGVGRLRVETRGRLVEQQQLGVVQHGPGQRQPGLHARRVAADPLVERVEDAEAGGGLADGLDRVAAEPVQLGGVLEVVPPRQPVVERGLGRRRRRIDGARPRRSGPGRTRRCARSPRSGVSAPVITRMAVVLPAPFGPSSTVMRPFGARMVRCDSAGTRPKAFDTSRISTTRSLGSISSTVGAPRGAGGWASGRAGGTGSERRGRDGRGGRRDGRGRRGLRGHVGSHRHLGLPV